MANSLTEDVAAATDSVLVQAREASESAHQVADSFQKAVDNR